MEDKIKVCAYCRVSTDSKDQLNSFENQLIYFKNKTHELGNYKLVKIYADKGLSATSMDKRVEFLHMIYDAGIDIKNYDYQYENKNKVELITTLSDREPKFNLILVKNSSRFARNIAIIPIIRKLREKKVYVKFLDKGISTEDADKDFMVNIFLSADERESKEKSNRVKFGHKAGMEKGVIMSNSRLYGYKKIDKYTLEVIEEEAKVIRLIFEEYAKGIGTRRIINILDELGYKTRQGEKFSKSTINRILQNEKYKGWLVRNKYYTGKIFEDKKVTPELRTKEDWIIHKDKIPAIVPEELWDKCQKIKATKVNHKNQKGMYHGTSDYANKIFCAKCGHTYTKNKDRERIFFNCGTKKTQGIKDCDNINISETKLNKVIESLANGLYYDHVASNVATIRGHLEEDLKYYKERLHKEVDIEEIQRLNNELEEVLKERKNYFKLLVQYPEDKMLNELIEENANNKKVIQEKINHLNMSKEKLNQQIKQIEKDIENLYTYQSKEKITTDELLKKEIKRIEIVRANEYYQGGYRNNIEEKTNEHVVSTNMDEKHIETPIKEDVKLAFGGYDEDVTIKEKRTKKLKKFYDDIYTKNNIVMLIDFNSVTLGIKLIITNKNDIHVINDRGIERVA